MKMRGVVRTADLQEGEGDEVVLLLRVQGVGPGQPRAIVVPFDLLVDDDSIAVEEVAGRAFEAEVEQDGAGLWVISRIAFAARVLRPGDPAG